MADCFFQEGPAHAAAPKFLTHVNADFRSSAVGGALDEGMKTEPARDLAIDLPDPERMRRCRMLPEPGPPLLDRNLVQLGSRNAAANSFVVDLDDRRKIGFQRIANDHAARMALSGAGAVS